MPKARSSGKSKSQAIPMPSSFFARVGPLGRACVGLEAGPLSQWLHAGLVEAGFETVLLETRHVKAALPAMTIKTDHKDARGIAQLLRMGWFRPVHCKSVGSQEVRALLVARKLLLGKLLDVEFSIRGILRGFGLKMGTREFESFELVRRCWNRFARRCWRCTLDYRSNLSGCTRRCWRSFAMIRFADV